MTHLNSRIRVLVALLVIGTGALIIVAAGAGRAQGTSSVPFCAQSASDVPPAKFQALQKFCDDMGRSIVPPAPGGYNPTPPTPPPGAYDVGGPDYGIDNSKFEMPPWLNSSDYQPTGVWSGQSFLVYAGSLRSDPTQGVVLVATRTPYPTKVGQYLTPTKDGALTLTTENGNVLTMTAANGSTYQFNVGHPTLALVLSVEQLATAGGVLGSISLPAYCNRLSTQPTAIQQKCSQFKDQAFANIQATAQARPYATSVATPLDPSIWGTPVPPGYIDPRYKAIAALTPGDALSAIHGHPYPLTSVWQAGVVPNVDPTSSDYQRGFGMVLVYAVGSANGKVPWMGRELFDMGGMATNAAKPFETAWACPRNLGVITITAVTGETGVVSFTSTAGVSGTLDMSTGAWTFSPQPTPPSVVR